MIAKESDFYVIGGTLRHDAPCYVERRADHDLFESLLRGEFCYLLTARQMGKSSLMVRTAQRLRERGINVLVLDLTAIGQNLTPEQWYDGLLARLGRQARLEDELDAFWRSEGRRGPCQRLFAALEQVVLPRLAERARHLVRETAGDLEAHADLVEQHASVVIFVDEIDTVRSLPFPADEFFAAMRECYNRRAESPELRRLAFCLLGVATPSDLIQDTRLTPFNIGRRIELHDFTAAEAAPLAQGLGLEPGAASAVLQRILYWTSGHPYLTQRLCKGMAGAATQPGGDAVDRLCATLFFSHRAREQDDNLLFVRDRLLRSGEDRASLLTLYDQVHRGRPGVRDEEANPLISVLRLSGVVRPDGEFLRGRNRIYLKAFDRAWVRANMPDAEVRRQRKAFQLGVIRTAGIAAVLVAMMAALVIYADRQARRAHDAYAELSRASWRAFVAQARSGRLLGRSGRRFEGLQSLDRAARIDPTLDVRNEALACLALADLRLGQKWTGHPTGTVGIAFSRDLNCYARGSVQGTLSVRSIPDDTELLRLPAVGVAARPLGFSPGRSYLAAVCQGPERPRFCLWDLKRESLVLATNSAEHPAFDFSDTGRLGAFTENGGKLHIVDLASRSDRVLQLASDPLIVRFRPGGLELAVSRAACLSVELLNVADGRSSKSLHIAGSASALAWSPDGQLLAMACPNRSVRVWNPNQELSTDLEGHQAVPTQLGFSSSGRLLASSGPDYAIRFWDPRRKGGPLVTFEGALDVPQLQFSPDDRRLAGGVSGESVQLWEVEPGQEYESAPVPNVVKLESLDVAPGGRLVACAHEGGVALWDLALASNLVSLAQGAANSAMFNPATSDLIVSEIQGLWARSVKFPSSAGSDQVLLGPRQDFGLSSGLDVAPDGGAMAIIRTDWVQVLDAATYALLAHLPTAPGVSRVVLAPGRRWVATADWRQGETWVCDLAGDKKRTRLTTTGRANLACSPDGTHLAVGTETVCALWKAGEWKPEKTFQRNRPGGRPALVAFSPDGTVLAFTAEDTRIALVDAASHASLAQIECARIEPLVALRFGPDGSRLIAATDATIETWDLAALRRGLSNLGLDWHLPSYASKARAPVAPLKVVFSKDDAPDQVAAQRFNLQSRVDQLSRRLEETPENPGLYRERAFAFFKLEEFEKSAADWEACLKLDPTNTWALRDLALILLTRPPPLRDYGRARELASKAAQLEPKNDDNHYRAGLASFHLGDYANALLAMQNAERVIGDKRNELVPAILLHEAMCHARLGRLGDANEARARAIKMIEEDPDLYEKHRIRLQEYRAEADGILGQ